jgi:hypothetical protein
MADPLYRPAPVRSWHVLSRHVLRTGDEEWSGCRSDEPELLLADERPLDRLKRSDNLYLVDTFGAGMGFNPKGSGDGPTNNLRLASKRTPNLPFLPNESMRLDGGKDTESPLQG